VSEAVNSVAKLASLAAEAQRAPWSNASVWAAMAIFLVCAFFPGWKSPTLSRASIQRRFYWTGTAVGAALLFVTGLPDWRVALVMAGAAIFVMVLNAFATSSHIKIDGKIYAGYHANRGPDPPPEGR